VSGAAGSKWLATRGNVVIATLTAAAAGVALGTAIAPERQEPVPADVPPRVGLASGVARLPLPVGWEPLGRRSSLPGLGEATAVRGVDADVALDIRAPEDPSLLPSAVVTAAGDVPKPTLLRLAGRGTWGYELPAAAPRKRLVALTLPTTGGVVTIACEALAEAIGRAAGECAGAMRALRVDGARVLPPAPETAARIALPKAIARLNGQRRHWRRSLAGTRSPRGRENAARRLADAYDAAGRRLRPLAAGRAQRLAAALAALVRDHRALAAASLRRDALAARHAGAQIEAGERRLGPLLRALSAPSAGPDRGP
jgi:hypothetical protein